MKLLILLVILLIFPIAASAERINGLEVEWEGSTSYTLSWANPTITKGNYTIKVIDFDWMGQATISVTLEGETQHGILSQGENSIFDFTKKNSTTFRGIKISAGDISRYERVNTSGGSNATAPINVGTFPCCPQAGISVALSKEITIKKPELELVLLLNWDGRAGFTSTMNVQIKNKGDGDFSEGNVTINISGLKLTEEKELPDQALTYNPSKGTVARGWFTPLSPKNYYSINLSVKSPVPANRSSFTIKVESHFRDSYGNIYSATTSQTVKILDTMKFEKKISPATILGEKTFGEIDKFFGLGRTTAVNIYITNQQSYNVRSVTLNDTVIKDFTLREGTISPAKDVRLLDNNTKLQWVFDLNASERKEFRYEMAAHRTGTFAAPAAGAWWNEWGAAKTQLSDQPTTRVYGVFVVVSKKADKTSSMLKESFNVTTTLENIGDFPVGINVTDIMPEKAAFISGTTYFSGFLRPKESVSLNYNLTSNSAGELVLPSPQVSFWKKEYDGSYGVIAARNVTVLEPSAVLPGATATQTITPAPTATPLPKSLIEIIEEKAPWLEGAVPIIMLFIAIILMLMLHIINR